MGWAVIEEPDGKLCVFSSVSNGLVAWDADEDEVRLLFLERAVEDALRNARNAIEHARGITPRRRHYPTYEEVVKTNNETFPDQQVELKTKEKTP